MKSFCLPIFQLVLAGFCTQALLAVPNNTATADNPAAPPTSNRPEAKFPAKSYELRRLDFRIENKSCPACLLGIQAKLKTFNGVLDAAVMVVRPYGASVIYRADKANPDYILGLLKGKDPTVKVVDISDSKIDSAPLPLIPPFMPSMSAQAPIPTPVPVNNGL